MFERFTDRARRVVVLAQDEARELAEAWGAEFVDAGDSGHLNSESGHGPWPDGLLRFARKRCVFDSENILNSIIHPI